MILEIIRCENLCFSYGDSLVLKDICLSVNTGDFIVIVGPNGGGKSTLIKLLVGLLTPTRGTIQYPNPYFFNRDSIVGYTPQDTITNKDFHINAFDAVLMGFLTSRFFGCRISSANKKEALHIMDVLGIGSIKYKKIGDLSGGQIQRVLIARALCGSPKLLIFDEPTSNIDIPTQNSIYDVLGQISAKHTIIIISHNAYNLMRYANNILLVNKTLRSCDKLGDASEFYQYS